MLRIKPNVIVLAKISTSVKANSNGLLDFFLNWVRTGVVTTLSNIYFFRMPCNICVHLQYYNAICTRNICTIEIPYNCFIQSSSPLLTQSTQ